MSNKTYKSDAIPLDPINLDKVNLVCPLEGLSNFRKWVAGYEDRFEHIRDFYQRSDDSAKLITDTINNGWIRAVSPTPTTQLHESNPALAGFFLYKILDFC